jgi:hypothetical protein
MVSPANCILVKPSFGRFVYYKLLTAVPVAAALIAIIRYSDAPYWPFVYSVPIALTIRWAERRTTVS